jgi:GDP-mannose 4,6-dehydratase
MKKALITGVTGMVGSHLADLLLRKRQWRIVGVCRWRSPIDNIKHLIKFSEKKKPKIQFDYADLNDYSSILNILKKHKPNYIFHLAAQSFPKASFDIPSVTFDTNITGTYRLLDAVVKSNLNPVIHVCSSSEVFGRVSKDKLPINEDCSFHPASPYAISKVGTDLIARFFFEAYKLKVLTTRMFTHTGPRRTDFFAESSFAKQIAMIEKYKKNKIVYVGNLKSLRTIADVRDAVRAYYLLVTKKPKFGEVYNIGGNKTMTVGEMLEYLISLSPQKSKIKIKIDKNRLRPIDADLQVPDVSKFKYHTGWKPKINYKKTLKDLLNYWRGKVKNEGMFLKR